MLGRLIIEVAAGCGITDDHRRVAEVVKDEMLELGLAQNVMIEPADRFTKLEVRGDYVNVRDVDVNQLKTLNRFSDLVTCFRFEGCY